MLLPINTIRQRAISGRRCNSNRISTKPTIQLWNFHAPVSIWNASVKTSMHPPAPPLNVQPKPGAVDLRLLLIKPPGTQTEVFYSSHPLTGEIVVVSTYSFVLFCWNPAKKKHLSYRGIPLEVANGGTPKRVFIPPSRLGQKNFKGSGDNAAPLLSSVD
jgi:hypothetical protein